MVPSWTWAILHRPSLILSSQIRCSPLHGAGLQITIRRLDPWGRVRMSEPSFFLSDAPPPPTPVSMSKQGGVTHFQTAHYP